MTTGGGTVPGAGFAAPTPMATDPLEHHRARAAAVLPAGDPAEVKQLYVELGAMWEEAHAGSLDSIPVLSLPETLPVVVGLLEGRAGLVLDAGCGPRPTVSIELARTPARDVVVMDMAVGTIRLARAVAGRSSVMVLGVVGDAEQLPFRDSAFDAVVCDDTIEHLPDDRAAVRELSRVTKQRGRVVIATPNRRSAAVLMAKARDLRRGIRRPRAHYFVSNSHLREYTWRELERLVRPWLRVVGRAGVGWTDAGWRRGLLNRAMHRHWAQHVGQLVVLELEPR